MRTLLMFSVFASGLMAQPKLPADVDPQSLSRLPLVKRADLSGESQRIFDVVAGKDASGKPRETAPMGPQATSLYSMLVAEPMNSLNMNLRKAKVGEAVWHICALLAARAYDENYEWASHETGAKRTMVEDKTIDAIRFHRSTDGLPERDSLLIRFGRAILEDHKVPSPLYAEVVAKFGKEGMYEISSFIGDYVMAAIMLKAVDQHHPTAPDLPAIAR